MMKWAVDAASSQPVYIGSLARNATGLACGCRCPHCGATLQAVNAGIPADQLAEDGRQDQHFRHHGVQQQDRCKISVAERAALKLLIEQGEILLPPPTKRHRVSGISGATYEGTATGEAQRLALRHSQMVDETTAELTLDDGRKLLVVLQGTRVPTDTGQWCAVIEIQVDDPEVALWEPARIMASARLSGQWLCFRKHWQDEQLAEEARLDASAKASAHLDPEQDTVDLPAWLSTKQRSECLLHWQIKTILATAREIIVPAERREVPHRMPNGQWHSRWIGLPQTRLTLSDIRWEQPREGFKPDIACTATDQTGSLGTFELIIEVAVSHRVGDAKLEKIAARQLACVELYAERIAGATRIRVDELRRLVLEEPSCKRWLFHRDLQEQARTATSALQQMAVKLETKRQEEEQRREQEAVRLRQQEERARLDKAQRRDWLASLSPHQAAREFLRALRCTWEGEPLITGNGMVWSIEELRSGLHPKGLAPLASDDLTQVRGLLWVLSSISAGMQRPNGRPLLYTELRTIAQDPRWRHLLLCAIDVYDPLLSEQDRSLYDADRALVDASIDRGSLEFVRPSGYDQALEVMFPELSEVLLSEAGTSAFATWRRAEITRQEQEAQREAERQERADELRLQALAEEKAHAERLRQAVTSFAHQFQWKSRDLVPRTIKQAIDFARTNGQRGDAAERVIRSAWDARETGTPIANWLSAQAPTSSEDVVRLAQIIEASWVGLIRRA